MAGFSLRNSVTSADSTNNISINDVIGNKSDTATGQGCNGNTSLMALNKLGFYHVHSSSVIYPRDAAPVTLTSGAGAYNEGTKVEVIPASTITDPFDIHWIIAGEISAQDDYVVKLYTGGAGSEVFWGEAAFSRDSNQVRGSQFPVQGNVIPANTRISASLLSGTGSDTVEIKLYTPYL